MTLHIIETDFEPDDAIAILAHASKYININLIVIVGESKSSSKIPIVRRFFDALKEKYPKAYSAITIIQGLGSDKKYPMSEQNEAFVLPDEIILDIYTAIYSNDPELVFMMKPPREAMITKVKCPRTTVYCYGSFNWRTLKLPIKEYQDLMSRYEKFYYFDSFTAIGEANSGLFRGCNNTVNNIITELITKWNSYTIEKCKENLNKIEKSPEGVKKYQRNLKIIENVSAGINEQFVIADICLLLCPQPTERVELIYLDPYPLWLPSTESNIFIQNSEIDKRREQLIINLDQLHLTQNIL